MTKDQVAELIEQIPDFLTPDEFLVALATKAAEVEREACAKVCLSEKDGWLNPPTIAALNNVLNGIRARGEK